MDDHVVGEAAGHIALLLAVHFLDKAFHDTACERCRSRPGALLHGGEDLVKALLDHVFGDLVFHPGSGRAPSGRINKGIGVIEPDAADDVQRILDILCGLAREADDDIRRDRYVRNLFADLQGQFDELLLGIMAVHPFENPVRAALQRQMDVSGCLGIVPDHPDQVVGQILGMRRHKADAPDAVYFTYFV